MNESERKSLRDCLHQAVEIPKSYSRYLACPVISRRENQIVVQTSRGTQIVFTIEDNALRKVKQINAIQEPMAFEEAPAVSGAPVTPIEAVWPGSDSKEMPAEPLSDSVADMSSVQLATVDTSADTPAPSTMMPRLETLEREIIAWKEQMTRWEREFLQVKNQAGRVPHLESQAAAVPELSSRLQRLDVKLNDTAGHAARIAELESRLAPLHILAGQLHSVETQLQSLQTALAQLPVVEKQLHTVVTQVQTVEKQLQTIATGAPALALQVQGVEGQVQQLQALQLAARLEQLEKQQALLLAANAASASRGKSKKVAAVAAAPTVIATDVPASGNAIPTGQPASTAWHNIGNTVLVTLGQTMMQLGRGMVWLALGLWKIAKQAAAFLAAGMQNQAARNKLLAATAVVLLLCAGWWGIAKVWPNSQGTTQVKPLQPAPLSPLPAEPAHDRSWAGPARDRKSDPPRHNHHRPVSSPVDRRDDSRGKVISPEEYEKLIEKNRQIQEWADMAKSTEVEKRRDAATYLRELKSAGHLLALLQDSDDQVCVTAVLAMGELRCNDAVPQLIDIAKNSMRPSGLREKAMLSLGEIKDERATDPLCEIFRDNKTDIDLRAVAAEVLALIGNVRVCKELVEALSSSEPLLQVASARALGHFTYHFAVDKLAELLHNKADNSVRVAAAEALGCMQDRVNDSAQSLLDVAGDANVPSEVRNAARDSLQKLSSRVSGELRKKVQDFLNGQ